MEYSGDTCGLCCPQSPPHSDTFTPLRHLQSRPRSWGGIWAKLGVSDPSDVLRLSDFPQPPPPSRRVWQRRVPSVLLWLKTFQGSGRRDIRAGCSALFAMGAPHKMPHQSADAAGASSPAAPSQPSLSILSLHPQPCWCPLCQVTNGRGSGVSEGGRNPPAIALVQLGKGLEWGTEPVAAPQSPHWDAALAGDG